MAFTLSKKYVYPPNFTEGSDTMSPDQRRIVVHLTGTSTDASDASDSQMIDKSDLQGPDAAEPTFLVIEEVTWSTDYDAVIVEWDAGSDEEALRLTGSGYTSFLESGGLVPSTTGGTGDLVVTTQGGEANSAFDITLAVRLKA